MSNQIFTDILIPAGTPFSKCSQPRLGLWNDCTNLKKIQNEDGYVGEYQKALQGDYVAAFASPSFDSCDTLSAQSVDKCNIELKFNQAQVDWLEQQVPIIAATKPPVLPATPLEASSLSVTPSEASSLSDYPENSTSVDFVFVSGILLFTLVILVGFRMYFKQIIADDQPVRQPTSNRTKQNIPNTVAKTRINAHKRKPQLSEDKVSEESMQQTIDDINSKLDGFSNESQRSLSKTRQEQETEMKPKIEESLLEIQHLFDRKLISESEYQALRKKALGL